MTVTVGFWLAWIGLFVVLEALAIFNGKPGDTFSENVWDWFSIKGRGRAWRLRRFVLLSLMAWLSLHFLTGGQF